jgi:hypothetical protein
MGPWMNAALIQSRAGWCARGQHQLGPVAGASDSSSSAPWTAPTRPGGARVGQLQLTPRGARVRQLQFGPGGARVGSSSTARGARVRRLQLGTMAPAWTALARARWCARPTAPVQPEGRHLEALQLGPGDSARRYAPANLREALIRAQERI